MGNLRVDGLLAEPLVAANPALRVDRIAVEPILGQIASLRVDAVRVEPQILQDAGLRVTAILAETYVTLLEPGPVSTAIFPAELAALAGFSVHRRPTFSTRIAAHVSGREVRAAHYVYPLREFELTFEALHSGAGIGAIPARTKQLLEGFWCALQGQYGTFLYQDPEDCSVTGGAIGTGDGGTTAFPLVRRLGTYAEPVGQVNTLSAVYLDGTALADSAYSVVMPNTLVFASAPGAGVPITADFTFWWQCRFLDDVTDFEELLAQIHSVNALKFRTVKP
jgi:uncharacterized protein (TIGR02217 family)